jgi:hypothetical protein
MRIRTSDTLNHALGSICEAVVLICATLELIAIYLYMSGSAPGVFGWLIGLGMLILLACIGSVIASYRLVEASRKSDEHAIFRINRQLTQTLKAEKVPTDVVVGLRKLIEMEDIEITGQSRFLFLLEETFGHERTADVKAIILKYAKVRSSRPALNP